MVFRFKVIAGIATAFAVLLAVAVFSHLAATNSNAWMQWVDHTHLVLEDLEAAQFEASDAESFQRGYIIIGSHSYLVQYQTCAARLKEKMQQVRDLTVDNPQQQAALNQLEPLIREKFEALDARIRTRGGPGLLSSATAADEITGGPLMDEIRDALAAMAAEEQLLLTLRSRELEVSLRRTRLLIISGNALGFFFLAAAGLVTYQEMQRRASAESAVRSLNSALETRVAERTAELAQRTNDLAERARDLERSNGELQQFAYVASHDLQEPLRTISSFTQLLSKRYRDKLDDKAREFIDFAVDGCKRMQAQINDLLSFSRVGTHGKPLQSVSCEAVLDRILKGFKIAIEESRASITHDPLPLVLADEVQLGQLLQNLIGNAMKFRAGDAPHIHISAVPDAVGWKISVRDDGIGIAPEHRDRVFVIFQRLHTKAEYPGTGIGLAICKKIAERHGGRIWFEPAPGKGTTFCFTIHAAQSNATETGRPDELRVAAAAH